MYGAGSGKVMKKVVADKRLFWFLKDGVQLNLSDPAIMDMYVQQVITYGGEQQIKSLFKTVSLRQLQAALKRIGRFIPKEVRNFWEDFIADNK
jgi:hypothetical protein